MANKKKKASASNTSQAAQTEKKIHFVKAEESGDVSVAIAHFEEKNSAEEAKKAEVNEAISHFEEKIEKEKSSAAAEKSEKTEPSAAKKESASAKKEPAPRIFQEFTKGIIKENPTLFGLLGFCPTLAITLSAINGVGMGLCTLFVLVCSNLVISLIARFIPKAVRLPSFIVVIAGFVTIVRFVLKGYAPDLYDALGSYLDLITVNCIILGRAEVFASKNKPVASIFDGLGMGLGFTLTLFIVGAVREIIGSGTIFGLAIPLVQPLIIFIMPPAGFFVLGVLIAVVNKLANKKPPQELGCHSCPNNGVCNGCSSKEEGNA